MSDQVFRVSRYNQLETYPRQPEGPDLEEHHVQCTASVWTVSRPKSQLMSPAQRRWSNSFSSIICFIWPSVFSRSALSASGKLKNRYHVTPSHFLILVYNLLIKSKREYFWFQLQSLKLYNGVHAVRSLYFLKISMLLVKIQNVTPSRFQNCNIVSFS